MKIVRIFSSLVLCLAFGAMSLVYSQQDRGRENQDTGTNEVVVKKAVKQDRHHRELQRLEQDRLRREEALERRSRHRHGYGHDRYWNRDHWCWPGHRHPGHYEPVVGGSCKCDD